MTTVWMTNTVINRTRKNHMYRYYSLTVTLSLSSILLLNQLASGVEQTAKASLKANKESPGSDKTPLDHTKVMVFRTASGMVQPVRSAADWNRRRADIVRGMEATMGPLPKPKQRSPLNIKILEETRTEKYLRQKITYQAEPGDQVPAYLLIPHKLQKPAPAMLCLHQTTRIGKGEPAGLGGKPALHYAHELAERGYICLAPDYPTFGDYPYDFNRAGEPYVSGTMKAIWNNVRGIDLLQSMPNVAANRIGCIGHSLGGHNTLFTSVFEQRIQAVVTSCGFTAFHHYYKGKLAPWAQDKYMPRVREVYNNDPSRISFDFYEIIAALAPRGVFINAPLHDGNFENTGVRKVVKAAKPVFKLIGKESSLQAVYPDCGHDFPENIRQQVYQWLDEQLK